MSAEQAGDQNAQLKAEDLGSPAMFGNAGGTGSGSNTPALAFGGGSPAPSALAFGAGSNRTNYANNSSSLGGAKKEENDVDDFGMTSTSFGPRSTGMGRVSSAEGNAQQTNGAGEPNRKRLRRGMDGLGDDSAASSRPVSTPGSNLASPGDSDPALASAPSAFTSGLQSRLADFNVDSGPPSSASSAYGGNGMQREGSWHGQGQGGDGGESQSQPVVAPGIGAKGKLRDDLESQSPDQHSLNRLVRDRPDQTPAGSIPSPLTPAPPMGYPGASPSNHQSPYANYSQLPQSSLPPSATSNGSGTPVHGQDAEFDRFFAMVGPNFNRDASWRAWNQANHQDMAAIGLLVNAEQKPVPSTSSVPSHAGMYSQVNAPLSTPQQQHYSQQQAAQARQPIHVLNRPQQQPPHMSSQAQPGMQAFQLQQQQQQQQRAIMTQQQQQIAMQQQQQAAAGMQGQQSGYGYRPQQSQQPSYPASAPHSGLSKEHIENFRRLKQKADMGQANALEQSQLSAYMVHLQAAQQSAQRAHSYTPQQSQPRQQGYPQNGHQMTQAQFQQAQYAQQQQYYQQNGVYMTPQQLQHQAQVQQRIASQLYGQQRQGQQQYHSQQPQKQRIPQQAKYQAPQTSGSILARQLAAASAGSQQKKKRRRAPVSDSDNDGGEYDSGGSGDEYGVQETPAAVARREALAIEFFNTCEKELLMELAGANATQATLTIKLRPFTTANDFRSRTRKQKGVGNNMMDTYLEVVTGMGEVDKVLSNCEAIGRELSQIMRIWQSGAAVTDKTAAPGQNAGGDVGLNIVAISEETIVQRVDTSQDPSVRAAFSGYIRRQPDGVPSSIVLKDYQMLGVNWLNLLYHRKTSCILADEMGLGKTAQVIALLAHLKATGDPGPHLVIVPSSTLENWMREFSVFAPDINAQSYYGSQSERAEIRHELREMEGLDVVVTTYNIATSSPDDQKFLKKKMDFKVAVFDEGHQLKNSESKKYKDLMQIKAQWRLLLTGTPLQNNLQELVSLLSFILPDQFRDANESLRAIFKVAPGQQANLLSRERISRAKKMMTPFVLRRKKAQVLKDLPQKLERIEWCEMTPLQREVYAEAINRSKKALMEADKDAIEELVEEEEEVEIIEGEDKPKPKPKKRGTASTKTGNKADTTSSTHVLTDLRKMSLHASNHPMLFRRIYTDEKLKEMSRDCLKELEFTDRDKDLIFEDMEVMTDFELHRFCLGYKHLAKHALTNDEWMSAGKIQKLQEMLPKFKENGDRVLLFSQFTQVLDILEVVLDTMGIKYLKLTGQTNVTERQGLVDEYSNDPDITVFLLSTRAGGLGLNLVAANTVIFYDQDYNPHNDKQAEDRAYRIGQKRDVNIIKFITKGSLEEDMRQLATNKLLLDSEVSSASQYPTGAAPPEDSEGNNAQVEKRMRTSLLSNLKKNFERESQAQTQAS